MSNETLGLILVRANKITRTQLYEALREQRATGQKLGEILFAKGWIGEEELTLLLAKQMDLEYVEPSLLEKVPKDVFQKFPSKVAAEYKVVPVRIATKGKLQIAMEDPKTRGYADELSYLVGQTCIPALASPTAVRDAIRRFYGIELASPLKTQPVKLRVPVPVPAPEQAAQPLQSLPENRVDESGHQVVAVKNASGQEEVFLLTDVSHGTPSGGIPAARPPSGPVIPASELIRVSDEPAEVAETDATNKMKARPKPKPAPAMYADPAADRTVIIDRTKRPPPAHATPPPAAAAPKPAPPPPPAAPAPAAAKQAQPHEAEAHDNFLAPDADDDRPMFKPKVVSGSKPAPAPTPPPAAAPPPPPSGEDFDIVRAAEKLFECQSPEQIAAVVCRFCAHLVDRAILFDVGAGRFRVLARAGTSADDDRGAGFEASPEELVLLGVLAQTQQPAYGPTPAGEMYDRFFDTMAMMKPPYILLYPLVVGRKTRAVLYGGLRELRPPEEFGDLQLLFKEAATALEVLGP